MQKIVNQVPSSKLRKVGEKLTYGRSAATGQFILVPITGKDGTITQKQADAAFQHITTSK
jgi:hypothetical protein